MVKTQVNHRRYLQKILFHLFEESLMIKLESVQEKSIIPLSKGFFIKIKLSLLKQREKKIEPDAIIFVSSMYNPLGASLSRREKVSMSNLDKISLIYGLMMRKNL
jgi:hypothetical protein